MRDKGLTVDGRGSESKESEKCRIRIDRYLREGGEVIVDGLFLQPTAIRRKALIQGNGVTARVLPVTEDGEWGLIRQ